MLYSTIILALVLPFACMWFYRQGVNDGRAIKAERPLTPIVAHSSKKSTESDRAKYVKTLLDNVDSYNGTEEGQIDVKR